MKARTRVDSSCLRSVGYDAGTQLLVLEFLTGRVYEYEPVPEPVHEALMSAGSHGRYFNQAVRGRFPYRRIR